MNETKKLENTNQGLKWPQLLLPFLLLFVWWLFKFGSDNRENRKSQTPPIVVQTIDTTSTITCELNWLFFDFNSSDLKDNAKTELDEMAAVMQHDSNYVAVIRAHTDFRGSQLYNAQLSEQRAANAKIYLTNLGIDYKRIKISIVGENDPAARNDADDASRQYNRRVELYVQDENGKNVCRVSTGVPNEVKIQ